jgi:hypothetical protein
VGCHGVMEAEVFYRDQELRRVAMYQSDWLGSVGFLRKKCSAYEFLRTFGNWNIRELI